MADYWLPDMLNVVYPLMIENQAVYDEGGNPSGLNVGINVRNKQVVSVWDLSVQNYQSSQYDAETDLNRIMKVAEQGGVYGYVDITQGGRVVEIELAEPTIQYVKMWNYKNNQSEELLIPSLVFPIKEQPAGDQYFYRKSVVVPLVKEILDRNNNPVKILPLEDPGSGSGSSGSATPPVPSDTPKSNQ
jgi:hypothetical protein